MRAYDDVDDDDVIESADGYEEEDEEEYLEEPIDDLSHSSTRASPNVQTSHKDSLSSSNKLGSGSSSGSALNDAPYHTALLFANLMPKSDMNIWSDHPCEPTPIVDGADSDLDVGSSQESTNLALAFKSLSVIQASSRMTGQQLPDPELQSSSLIPPDWNSASSSIRSIPHFVDFSPLGPQPSYIRSLNSEYGGQTEANDIMAQVSGIPESVASVFASRIAQLDMLVSAMVEDDGGLR
jgi:hypothetical protein